MWYCPNCCQWSRRKMESITVVCPMFNEVRFAKAWCENVIRYANQIIVVDTGSTDGTLDILRSYKHSIEVHQWGNHNECEVRHALLALARCDWVLRLDADELLIAEDILRLKTELPTIRERFVWLPHYLFWRNTVFLRARQFDWGWNVAHNYWMLRDATHFHPCYEPILWKNSLRVRYTSAETPGWNSHFTYSPYGRIGPRLFGTRRETPIRFHYHYALRDQPRVRINELSASGIRCETYTGPHPEEIKYYEK